MNITEYLLNLYLNDLIMINRNSIISDLIELHLHPMDNISLLMNQIIQENPLI